MAESKYAEYIRNEPLGDMTGLYPALKAPMFRIRGNEWDVGYTMDWFCVTEPFLMINEPHTHDFDQFLVFQGGNPTDIREFDAEVWLYLGEEQERITITSTSFVHVPKGMVHTPLEFKRIGKPIIFMDITLTPQYVRKPVEPK